MGDSDITEEEEVLLLALADEQSEQQRNVSHADSETKNSSVKIVPTEQASRSRSPELAQSQNSKKVFDKERCKQDELSDSGSKPTENNEPSRFTSKSPVKKRSSSPIIAYVHKVSPVKRSRKGNLQYCNLKLQSASGMSPAVCYSRSKRGLLVNREQSKTAVQIERYNMASDGETVFINEMTRFSTPSPTTYNFQFDDPKSERCTLKSILETSIDMDLVDFDAKVVKKDQNEPEVVGKYASLRKSHCYVADKTASLKLVLWEENIDQIKEGQVYEFREKIGRASCRERV